MIDWIIEDCRPGVAGLISATGAISSPDEGDESMAHASGTVGVAVQLTAKCSLSRHGADDQHRDQDGDQGKPVPRPSSRGAPRKKEITPAYIG